MAGPGPAAPVARSRPKSSSAEAIALDDESLVPTIQRHRRQSGSGLATAGTTISMNIQTGGWQDLVGFAVNVSKRPNALVHQGPCCLRRCLALWANAACCPSRPITFEEHAFELEVILLLFTKPALLGASCG